MASRIAASSRGSTRKGLPHREQALGYRSAQLKLQQLLGQKGALLRLLDTAVDLAPSLL